MLSRNPGANRFSGIGTKLVQKNQDFTGNPDKFVWKRKKFRDWPVPMAKKNRGWSRFCESLE